MKSNSNRERDSLDPSTYPLTKEDLKGIRRSDIASYTNDILRRLFSDTDLAACSMTGSNFPANEGPARPGLSPNRLHAARSKFLI